MRAEFWQKRWAEGQIGFHQAHVNDLLARHWHALSLPKESKVFVPLCGKSLDMLWLRQQGHWVVANELVESAVKAFFQETQQRSTQKAHPSFIEHIGDGIQIFAGDYFALTPEMIGTPIQGFFDRAALVAMPPETQAAYCTQLASLVPAGTPGLLVCLEQEKAADQGPPFSLTEERIHALLDSTFELTLIDTVEIEFKSSPAKDKVYRLVRR